MGFGTVKVGNYMEPQVSGSMASECTVANGRTICVTGRVVNVWINDLLTRVLTSTENMRVVHFGII
jgi:hypothetical protein